MKTIDTRSLLLGIVATLLVFTLTSGKISSQDDETIEFVASPRGVGIYNKSTKTLYFYRVLAMRAGIKEKPDNIYVVADDGSGLTKKE